MGPALARRRALKLGAASAALPLVHVRTARAAGKLTAGLWDHWGPGANDTVTKQVKEWGEANKVDVSIDYITSVGNKDLLTIAAESQAKYGAINPIVDYLSRKGAFQTAPSSRASRPPPNASAACAPSPAARPSPS